MSRDRWSRPLAATDPKHGTRSGYGKGCSCEACRTANAAHSRDLYAANADHREKKLAQQREHYATDRGCRERKGAQSERWARQHPVEAYLSKLRSYRRSQGLFHLEKAETAPHQPTSATVAYLIAAMSSAISKNPSLRSRPGTRNLLDGGASS